MFRTFSHPSHSSETNIPYRQGLLYSMAAGPDQKIIFLGGFFEAHRNDAEGYSLTGCARIGSYVRTSR